MYEDIACQITLRLPVITLAPEKQAYIDQRQEIVSTAGGAAIAGSGFLIFAVLRYIINVVMANIVSVSVYGTYNVVLTSATLIGSFAELGLDSTILRFLSTYRAQGEARSRSRSNSFRGVDDAHLGYILWRVVLYCCSCPGTLALSSRCVYAAT